MDIHTCIYALVVRGRRPKEGHAYLTCAYIYIHIHKYICTSVCVCMYGWMHIHAWLLARMDTPISTHPPDMQSNELGVMPRLSCRSQKTNSTEMCVCVCAHAEIDIYTYTYIYIYICQVIHHHIHTYMHACMHACIHAYTHTYIRYTHTLNTYHACTHTYTPTYITCIHV